jgi:hypothetical protein
MSDYVVPQGLDKVEEEQLLEKGEYLTSFRSFKFRESEKNGRGMIEYIGVAVDHPEAAPAMGRVLYPHDDDKADTAMRFTRELKRMFLFFGVDPQAPDAIDQLNAAGDTPRMVYWGVEVDKSGEYPDKSKIVWPKF